MLSICFLISYTTNLQVDLTFFYTSICWIKYFYAMTFYLSFMWTFSLATAQVWVFRKLINKGCNLYWECPPTTVMALPTCILSLKMYDMALTGFFFGVGVNLVSHQSCVHSQTFPMMFLTPNIFCSGNSVTCKLKYDLIKFQA